MEDNFWLKLDKPILALAPMEDITDAAFRRIIAKYGKPSVLFTEFVCVDAIVSERGRERVLKDLDFDGAERPIVAQLFGSNPVYFNEAAKTVADLGFDGIDINMGCPDKAVVKQCAGSALINDLELAKEIVAATKEGAGDKPVSVKTRLGFNQIDIEGWIKPLLETKPVALTIHGRTKKEMSRPPAHWDAIGQIAEMAKGSDVLIIGNGDIQTRTEAVERAAQYNLDGTMVGRGIFGNPWFFNQTIKKEDLPLAEVLKVLIEHIRLFDQLLIDTRPFMLMRKHFSSYLKGYVNVKDLKAGLMETKNSEDAILLIEQYLRGKG